MNERFVVRAPAAERAFVVLVAALAGVRVFLGAAALPFFANTDEQAHFDLVCKYARGHWNVRPTRAPSAPRDDHFDSESATLIARYGSSEYLHPPSAFPGGVTPAPVWRRPPAERDAIAQQGTAYWQSSINHETPSPPVYYLVAAGWYLLGEALGLRGGALLYWVRFLNVPVYVALVVLAYGFCRRYYPGRSVLRLGVPVLLAFLAQDIFYSINNDILSPLAFLAALAALLAWYQTERPGYRLCVAAGVLAAGAFLVKYSNVAIVVVLVGLVVRRGFQLSRRGLLAAQAGRLTALVGAAAAPIALWLVRNRLVLGDFFGTQDKLRLLGWTPMPWIAMFSHPLFTPRGVAYFFAELLKRFWRGEMVWHGQALAVPAIDPFFVGLSVVFIAAAVYRFARRSPGERVESLADGAALMSVGVSVLFLMYVSLAFDFGRCWYPSRESPYLVSGRLIIGVLAPFLILYVRGLDFLFSKVARIAGPLLGVGATVVLMVLSKLGPLLTAGQSAYNYFHLSQ